MSGLFETRVKFDLLRVGSCSHPECAALRGGGIRAIDFPALVGLVEHPRLGLMLYDTGYSRHFAAATRSFPECLYRLLTPVRLPPGEELLVQLEERGLAASDIGTIFISHFHADHVAGLRDFPSARFIATSAEHRLVGGRGRLGRLRGAYLRDLLPSDFESRLLGAESFSICRLPDTWSPFREGFDLAGDGSLVGIDLPGHTASQLGLAFRTEGEPAPLFLVGDACWKVEGLERNRPPSRLAYGLFHDGKAYDETFAALRGLHLRGDGPSLIPSHCSTTWERRGGQRSIRRE